MHLLLDHLSIESVDIYLYELTVWENIGGKKKKTHNKGR
jgi:hypothetical protein